MLENMIKEDKKIVFFLLAIVAVLIFTFTLANHVNGISQNEALWRHRTEADVIYDLRREIVALGLRASYFAQENRYLRKLVYTTKPDHWATWIALLDNCKKLEKRIKIQREEIKILEKKLDIRLWQMLVPYRKI